ncbi:MAG TPA: trehalose-6-phosphate synthase, partial [Candidatus Polarisedimenticolaceae bacterium]|nr:trehalose-6-phosphate synthase [Candidatus Polarisedimenticolaceae bacterium]
RKRSCLTLHTRGMPPAQAAEAVRVCEQVWRREAATARVVPVDGGIELRLLGRDKGTAVRELIDRAPTGTFPVYLGDDATDEDAFRALLQDGFGIRVGPRLRPSLARGRLGSWEAVPAFLQHWLEQIEPAPETIRAGVVERLVVVSNRLPSVGASGALGEPEVPVGGLASAVFGALQASPGSLWFGWNGRIVSEDRPQRLTRLRVGGVTLAGLPLTHAEVDDYYLGYCNGVLWPLLHCFQSHVKIRLRQEQRYREVQARFATALRPLLRPGDLIWIHDYHLLLLARELRRLGWGGRIGFFLHTPFPPHELWTLLPDPRDTIEALLDYDVVGFHVAGFLDNYVYCCRRELGASWDGATLTAGARSQRVGVYPVGIDPEAFRPQGARTGQRREVLDRVVRDRSLILGVDRLDYTKGIPARLLAYEQFLRRYPERRRHVLLLQIASPSRTGVPEYNEQKLRVEALLGRINGELGDHDWVPIRYLYRTYGRDFLAKLYREADVGLVTPLRDGMNLVAKEFVAAQYPDDPGVLVLSRCAGAAQELVEALLVNPYVPRDVAEGIERALSLPLEERRERHAALLARVRRDTAREWGRRFVADLRGAAVEEASPLPAT